MLLLGPCRVRASGLTLRERALSTHRACIAVARCACHPNSNALEAKNAQNVDGKDGKAERDVSLKRWWDEGGGGGSKCGCKLGS